MLCLQGILPATIAMRETVHDMISCPIHLLYVAWTGTAWFVRSNVNVNDYMPMQRDVHSSHMSKELLGMAICQKLGEEKTQRGNWFTL